ncbi:MAG: divalent metal cation transporter [Planctomycetota bacterium]|nr:divalent metal cation transporter [Planctomycetota bacterium]
MAYQDKITSDREILKAAHQKGTIATFLAFFRLSGPGWLQAAITLGGGSLGSALYLGVLGGSSMLWLQLIAIIAGVIMLSAISYVTLSTGQRPYKAINEYINPVLGVGWLVATILANMIWIMPQFSLCFDALDKNLGGDVIQDTSVYKYSISGGLFVLAGLMVYLSSKKGFLTRMFDLFLKLVIAVIIICFAGVVVILFQKEAISLTEIFQGFIPDLSQWNNPSTDVQALLAKVNDPAQAELWKESIVKRQREVMISTAATAVGLNMTFLLPYSLLARRWDRPFRGLANFDLVTGMAIPFILVTSCIVIASAHSFHAKADALLLSQNPAEVKTSSFFKSAAPILRDNLLKKKEKYKEDLETISSLEAEIKSLKGILANKWFDQETQKSLSEKQGRLVTETEALVARLAPDLPNSEKTLATVLVKPNANQLAQSLVPLLGKQWANLVFGAGALAMGFSTIIILMMINGYAVRELFGKHDSQKLNLCGAYAAGIVGVLYPVIWGGTSKTWLVIMASTFGAMLLPIAYVAFFFMMNNRRLMGEHKPAGIRMLIWNLLMTFSVVIAFSQAIFAIQTKLGGDQGMFVLGAAVTFVILAVIGFSARRYGRIPSTDDQTVA